MYIPPQFRFALCLVCMGELLIVSALFITGGWSWFAIGGLCLLTAIAIATNRDPWLP